MIGCDVTDLTGVFLHVRTVRSQATEPECNSFTCFQTTSEKEDNRMKNVPVPVYCRPLVEKDPNRKVRRSTFNAGVTKKKKK